MMQNQWKNGYYLKLTLINDTEFKKTKGHYHDDFVIDCDKPIEASASNVEEAQWRMQQAEWIKEEYDD